MENVFSKIGQTVGMTFAPQTYQAVKGMREDQKRKNAFAEAGEMFNAGDYTGASQTIMPYDMGAGIDFAQYGQDRAAAEQNEQLRRTYEGVKLISQQTDLNSRMRMAQELSAELGLPQVSDPNDLTDHELAKDLEMIRIKGGFEADQGEAYTLAPGAVRFGADNQVVAENPKVTEPQSTFSVMTTEQEIEHFGADMPGSYQIESGTNKVSPVSGTAPRAPLVQNTINPDAPPMPGKKTLTPLQLRMDERYTDLLVDWNIGGAGDAVKQLDQLGDVADILESGENISGWVIGNMPDWMLSGLNPQAMDAKELVQEVVQRSLRDTLGSQFTEREGEMLLARAYNPRLEERYNAARLRRLTTMIESRAQQLNSLNEYMQRNGTSAGWDGSLMSANQILAELDKVSGGANTPQKSQNRRVFNPATGEFEG